MILNLQYLQYFLFIISQMISNHLQIFHCLKYQLGQVVLNLLMYYILNMYLRHPLFFFHRELNLPVHRLFILPVYLYFCQIFPGDMIDHQINYHILILPHDSIIGDSVIHNLVKGDQGLNNGFSQLSNYLCYQLIYLLHLVYILIKGYYVILLIT